MGPDQQERNHRPNHALNLFEYGARGLHNLGILRRPIFQLIYSEGQDAVFCAGGHGCRERETVMQWVLALSQAPDQVDGTGAVRLVLEGSAREARRASI
jgi:hypothetical protein